MKINAGKKAHLEAGPNMTPLVDVVMVILIFLMLCGSFGGSEKYLESVLPLRKSGSQADASRKQSALDDITMDIRIDGFSTSAGKMEWQVSFNNYVGEKAIRGDAVALKDALAQALKAHIANGNSPDKLQVLLSPGNNVKWKWITTVYTATSDVGFTKVGFVNR